MRKKQPDINRILALTLGSAIIFIAGITVPISDNRDVFITVSVEKPLCGLPIVCNDAAKISDISAYAAPHTLLETPNLASLVTSGKIKITAEAGNRKSTVTYDDKVIRGTSDDFKLTLKDISKSQNSVTVKLYEDNTLVDTQTITIVEAPK